MATALLASVVKNPASCSSRPCTYTLDTAGGTADATENGELQSSIDDAERGDTIELTAGKIWTCNGGSLSGSCDFASIAGSSGYLTVRSTQYAKLPASGTRVTPSHAANMAQIRLVSASNAAVLRFPAGASAAQYVRLTGIEITSADDMDSGDSSSLDLVRLGIGSPTGPTQMPNFIEFDRCYIHGSFAGEIRNAVLANGRAITIIDSWISEIKMAATETHAVVHYDGPGPLTITNTWLEATAIPVLIGGGPQSVDDATMMPANISITNSTFYKPLKWYSLNQDYVGTPYTNKNHLEFKIGNTGTVQRNVFANNYFGANNDQSGAAIAVNIRMPNGSSSSSYAKTDNVTISNNQVRGTLGGFSVLGTDTNYSYVGIVDNLIITNNLVWDAGCKWSYLGCVADFIGPQYFRIIAGGRRLTFTKNTLFGTSTDTYMYMNAGDGGDPDVDGTVFNNNIGPFGGYGWRTGGVGSNETSINGQFSNASYTVDVRGNTFPSGASTEWDGCTGGKSCGSNVYPSAADFNNNVAPLWRDPAAGDFEYKAASAYRSNGLSGARMGAEPASIPRIYGVSVDAGSTKAVITWSVSPVLASTVCTAEVSTDRDLVSSLGAYAVVTDVDPTTSGRDLQTRTGNISFGAVRTFVVGYNSALTASTTYFYRVTCGPEYFMGSFATGASAAAVEHVMTYATARTGEYSSSPDMSSPTAVSSATVHRVVVPSGSVRYYRQTGGPILPLISR